MEHKKERQPPLEIASYSFKEILSAKELAEYTTYSLKYIYKLVHERKLKFYKPKNGRKLFFLRSEIDKWLLENQGLTVSEIINNKI